MKTRVINQTLAKTSLYLGTGGVIASLWILMPLTQIWDGFLMFYLYAGGIFICTGLSILISMIGLVLGIVALMRNPGGKRIAVAGIVLGTIGALQIFVIVVFSLNPRPIV